MTILHDRLTTSVQNFGGSTVPSTPRVTPGHEMLYVEAPQQTTGSMHRIVDLQTTGNMCKQDVNISKNRAGSRGLTDHQNYERFPNW